MYKYNQGRPRELGHSITTTLPTTLLCAFSLYFTCIASYCCYLTQASSQKSRSPAGRDHYDHNHDDDSNHAYYTETSITKSTAYCHYPSRINTSQANQHACSRVRSCAVGEDLRPRTRPISHLHDCHRRHDSQLRSRNYRLECRAA